MLLDISATHENRTTLLDTVRRTARQFFIPFTVGGGIRSLDDASAVFDAGADKVASTPPRSRTRADHMHRRPLRLAGGNGRD